MKKLLNSHLLRAVEFKCKTSSKSVTPVQINEFLVEILDYDWLKEARKFYKPMISRKKMMKFSAEKSFLEWDKMTKDKIFWYSFMLHTVFSFYLDLIYTCEYF